MAKKLEKYDWIERGAISLCLLFAASISLFHIAYNGYLGLNDDQWGIDWVVSENALSLVMSILIAIIGKEKIKIVFSYFFIPYFSLKLIYHFSCFSKIVVFSKEYWEEVWGFVLVVDILMALVYCVLLTIKRRKQNVAKIL